MKLTQDTIKPHLKNRFGDKYPEFMIDLNNINMSKVAMCKKWNCSDSTLDSWIRILGYKHDWHTKQSLRNQYIFNKRVKHRQETSRQFIELLKRRNSLLTK